VNDHGQAKGYFHAAIGTMVGAPIPLMKRIALLAGGEGVEPPSSTLLAETLREILPNDPAALDAANRLRSWDHVEYAEWTQDTSPNTPERRHRIGDELAVYGELREAIDVLVPAYVAPGPVVITASQVDPWYTYEQASAGFYWKEYVRYLTGTKGWTSVDGLDRSTFSIVANLTNPAQSDVYQARGLVVGHVQSGKTANFTGVIARAADAGYRLVIVLTGTTNILRHQTQRRIDKELIGQELLGSDYLHDPDWSMFSMHGDRPSVFGSVDWLRLTGPRGDYALLGYGGPVLSFRRADATKPFFDPQNLANESARIMVVKKNAGVLAKVAKDLAPYQSALAQVPVLIIDDESDQASLNTAKPTAADVKKRTAVNKAILNIIETLPRSQYVGYTATPFANVFANPDEAGDLFPRDFIVSLETNPGYMGAADFHDLNGRPTDGRPSNEDDFVRSARGADDEPENLLRAIDSFVLAGGMKLFREHVLETKYPHHTMLIHVSQSVDDHTAMRDLVLSTISLAGYRNPSAIARLRTLWEEDFRRVSAVRGPAGGHPQTFEEVVPFIAETVDRLFTDGKSVLIVNGQKESDTPDFDRDSVWKILVGGNKLSRGYTIEGLTVSYYRRRADAADTLMQMGRWFGYRAGYEDLVRLYIGREEPMPNGQIIDLYMAFEGACRDELAFRTELKKYAGLPGDQRIRPFQVPPLVLSHMLRPTAPNKMHHARLLATNLGGDYREPTVAPSSESAAEQNQAMLRKLVRETSPVRRQIGIRTGSSSRVVTWQCSPPDIIAFLKGYKWAPEKFPVERDVDFLTGAHVDPEIDDWLIVAPQLIRADVEHRIEINGELLTVKNRQRDATGGRYAVYSEPDHVLMAKFIAGHDVVVDADDELAALAKVRRGVMLLYPVQWYGKETLVTIGFGLAYPPNSQPKQMVWGVLPPESSSADTPASA
jgi:hypothetical protein